MLWLGNKSPIRPSQPLVVTLVALSQWSCDKSVQKDPSPGKALVRRVSSMDLALARMCEHRSQIPRKSLHIQDSDDRRLLLRAGL